MEKLYGVLMNDDPFCAQYTSMIFTSKEQAFEYMMTNDNSDFECIEEWEFTPEKDRYLSIERYYKLNGEILKNNKYWDRIETMKGE